VTKTFTCARTLIGQHVFLQLVGVEGSLSVCEVEVFTTNGKNCRANRLVQSVTLSAYIFRRCPVLKLEWNIHGPQFVLVLQSPSMEMSG
jgi:hypothetical protein